MLPTPSFHHLHLNAVDPDAAIGFYTRQFTSTAAGSWAGYKALIPQLRTPHPTTAPKLNLGRFLRDSLSYRTEVSSVF